MKKNRLRKIRPIIRYQGLLYWNCDVKSLALLKDKVNGHLITEMTRSAIKHKLCGFFWVAKRMAKRLTFNLRDTTYGRIKSSRTKYPVEGESFNTKSELDTFRK